MGWRETFGSVLCGSGRYENRISNTAILLERRPLEDVIQEFGLEVPYQTPRLQDWNSTGVQKNADSESEDCCGGECGDVECMVGPVEKCSSVENVEVSRGLRHLVKSAEVSRPVRFIKAAVKAVSFRREDNVKHEVYLRPTQHNNEDLSIEHFQRLEDAFNLHDSGRKGYLTKSELRSCLRTLGHNPTEQELWRFMAQVDVDHSGTLDFDEFFNLMSSMMCGWDPYLDLGICWRALDPRGEGRIRTGPFLSLLHRHGAQISQQEIKEIFSGTELDTISFQDFYRAIIIPDSSPVTNY